jgi:hypothetical protein
VIATSERSLLTVLLPPRQLRQSIEIRFQAAVTELLDALELPTKIVNRELAAVQPISFAAASNRRVIGSMNEFVGKFKVTRRGLMAGFTYRFGSAKHRCPQWDPRATTVCPLRLLGIFS